MKNIGKHEVIMVCLVAKGSPFIGKPTFSGGRLISKPRTIYQNAAGEYFINYRRKKRQVIREHNCFVVHSWTFMLSLSKGA